MWSTAEPVVRDWIERNSGRSGCSARPAAARSRPPRPRRLPGPNADGGDARPGLFASRESVDGIGRAEARRARWGNPALWVIAALLAVLTFRVMT